MGRLDLHTDFSKYLVNSNLRFHHQVKVYIDNQVLECNGALLANQSPVLHDLFIKSNELHLDEFKGLLNKGVMECLILLYGGEASITVENIQTVLQFAVLYKVQDMFTICQAWVLKNITVDNFHDLYKTAKFIDGYKREPAYNYTPVLGVDVCSDILLHHPYLAINKLDESMANIIIDKSVLRETLPIIIAWIDSSDKVDEIIDKVENVFSDILVHREMAIELIEKMCNYMTNVVTCKRVIKMHNQLLKDREPERAQSTASGSSSGSSVSDGLSELPDLPSPTGSALAIIAKGRLSIFEGPDLNSFSGEALVKRGNYLKGKKWRLCTTKSIKEISSKDLGIFSGFMYVEILLDWIEFSRPDAKVVGELWASIHDIHLAKGYLSDCKDHVQQKFGFRMPVPKAMNYRMGRCCFSIDKEQKDLMLQNEPILLLMDDCLVGTSSKPGSCLEDKRRVLSFRLCHNAPCYVMENKAKKSSEVCHWYIGISSAKKMSVLSLVTKNRGEIGRALDGVSHKNIFLNCLVIHKV